MEQDLDDTPRAGEFATSRRSRCAEDAPFIQAQLARGAPLSAVARMLGRHVEDVRAVADAELSSHKPRCTAQILRLPNAAFPPGRSKQVRPRPMPPRIARLVEAIAADYGCSLGEMIGGRGSETAAVARHCAYHAVRNLPPEVGARPFSYAQIGGWFGGRDHTTVRHGVEVHAQRLAEHRGASEGSADV